MAEGNPRWAVHWIDHVAVGTNDMSAWVDWAIDAIGVPRQRISMLTTQARKRNQPIFCFLPYGNGSCRIGAFLQSELFPPAKEWGQETPRFGFFVRGQELEEHLRRLDQHGIPHSEPTRITDQGDQGTTVYFQDPDGNQYEFWAPEKLPDGAMEVSTSAKVGRISHAVYGSRNLERTASFFRQYCGLTQLDSPDIPDNTLVLRLLGGARIIFKHTNAVDQRVAGHRPWWDMHTALTVRHDEFFSNYRRMWDGLPEEKDTKEKLALSLEEEEALPARTAL
ncbi:MAG: hypothetical protein GTO40_19450, partial [Deltaproteobacteria bacterium]|nr:hypothetical protein [Deltaproteobacteria bacterium]